MGLFDPPYKNMLSKIPVHAKFEADIVETLIEVELAEFDKVTMDKAKGVVLSVWICNSAMAGKFQLRDFDFRLIQNLGGTSFNFLKPPAQNRVESVLNRLRERGLI